MIYDKYDYEMFELASEAVQTTKDSIEESYSKQQEYEKVAAILRNKGFYDSAELLDEAIVAEVKNRTKLGADLREQKEWYAEEKEKFEKSKESQTF